MAERRCAHEPCHCEPDHGWLYCAPGCAEAAAVHADQPAQRCGCGHPECDPRNVPPDQPPPAAQAPSSSR